MNKAQIFFLHQTVLETPNEAVGISLGEEQMQEWQVSDRTWTPFCVTCAR